MFEKLLTAKRLGALGFPSCTVCGIPSLGPVLKMADGRLWCLKHKDLPRCQWCQLPLMGAPAGEENISCRACQSTAISSSKAVVPFKDEVKLHMASLGIRVNIPTRIKLVPPDTFGARSTARSHTLGTTTWTQGPGVMGGPIEIAVVRGLPRPRFRHVMAHEFAHAAMAGSAGSRRLGPRIQEGFAEALSVVHLRTYGAEESELIGALMENPDPTYGDGLRLVITAVDRFGLPETYVALRSARPHAVGLSGL